MHFNSEDVYYQLHLLAYYYHWDRNILWKLPRKERIKWLRNIEKQLEAENKSAKESSKDTS